jgi:transglutaminase-like putative cysteine protease
MALTTLYTPSQPNWLSRPAVLNAEFIPGNNIDLSGVRAEPGIIAGESYTVQASPPNATISELRSAGTEYPEWITDRYLQVPDTITSRTRALAAEIAAGKDNPYDITVAVTEWLRNNITYADTIPAQPARQDAVDWFLFDLRQGFCNYYATAEVILLRSLGIPARWSIGYAQGEKLTDSLYIVRQRDALAWPEVYFPEIGWVEFEPTAAQPVITRLDGGEINPSDLGGNLNEELQQIDEERRQLLEEREFTEEAAANSERTLSDYLRIFLGIAAALLALGLIMRFFLPPLPVMLIMASKRLGLEPAPWLTQWADRAAQKAARRTNLPPFPIIVEKSFLKIGARPPAFIQHWSQLVQLPGLSRSYLEINRALRRIGKPGAETDTPMERANTLGSMIPLADQPAHQLVTEYQLGLFSTQQPDQASAHQAGQLIRRLSWRKLFQSWLTRLQESPRNQRRSLFDKPGDDEQTEKTFEI